MGNNTLATFISLIYNLNFFNNNLIQKAAYSEYIYQRDQPIHLSFTLISNFFVVEVLALRASCIDDVTGTSWQSLVKPISTQG